MKKLYLLLLSLFVVPTLAGSLTAQDTDFFRSPNDPEKIYLFDSTIEVLPDSKIRVTEKITINAKGQQIRRGIYRDMPLSVGEKITPISLQMDNQNHPFFTEHKGRAVRVNFGDDRYISHGVHTYSFVYEFNGAINFLRNYDELYWNVTGNGWNFTIDKAKVRVLFPSNVNVQRDGISLYTGSQGSKQNNTQAVGYLAYETTRPLYSYQGLTIAVPFDKGAITQPPLTQRLKESLSWVTWLSAILFVGLCVFFLITWLQVGKDPSYLAIPRYTPPDGISPAFMYYLYNEQIDPKFLSCAILDMAMKGYIQIEQVKKTFQTKTQLVLLKEPAPDAPFEENQLRAVLFPLSKICVLDTGISTAIQALWKRFTEHFKEESKDFIVSNTKYLLTAMAIALLLGTLPPLLARAPEFIFLNLHFAAFFLVFTLAARRLKMKFIFGFGLTLFYSAFWIGAAQRSDLSVMLCQLFYILSMWGVTCYATLIRNVTPLGKVLFEQMAGFKNYIKTAEVHRVAASDPQEAERIFCDYLPYAFAMGLSNQWMKKFTNVLSKTVVDKCVACAGGAGMISRGLSTSFSRSMPSGRGGGSHGGGCSGGGHGGGGGGGR